MLSVQIFHQYLNTTETDRNLLINIFITNINYENWIWLSFCIVTCSATPSLDSWLHTSMKRLNSEHKHRFNWSHPLRFLSQRSRSNVAGQKLNYYPSTVLSLFSVPFNGGRRVRGHLYRFLPLHQHISRKRSRFYRPSYMYCFQSS